MVQLDPSQLAVAAISPEQKQVVIAGPGAGKSEVVSSLAQNLVDEHAVYPEEVLVISFSQAAVAVVRHRTEHVEDEGGGVKTSTIDALAAVVRREVGDEAEFTGYTNAIQRATAALKTEEELDIDHLRHVVIDEVQDVVDVRATFVLALLKRMVKHDIGFTLLGDPMQALYDFQEEEGEQTVRSDAFLEEVQGTFDVDRRVLTGEYRSRTADARAAASQRSDLQELDPYAQVLALRRLHSELETLGRFDEYAAEDVGRWSGRTALLCDTNARAALVAAEAAKHRLQVELAAGVLDRGLPDWIGRVLAGPERKISRDQFFDRAQEAGLDLEAEHWTALLNVAKSARDLDISDLVERLPSRRNDVILRRQPTASVLASTVHRAKGLEFDNVVLVDAEDWDRHPKSRSEGASRRLFVALTRAQSRLSWICGVSTKEWHSEVGFGGHRMWFKRRRGGLIGVILEAADARELGPVSANLDAAVGEPVTWQLAEELCDAGGMCVPSWGATVEGQPVARTGWDFGQRMAQKCRGDRVPGLIGGRVEGLETVYATTPRSGAEPLLWLGARVTGPLDVDWSAR